MRRYRIAEHGIVPHFITWTIVGWTPVFLSDKYCRIVTDSLEYCRQHKGLLVHSYVIMPTHIHLIVSSNGEIELSDILRDSRKHISKQLVEQLQLDDQKLFLWIFRDAAKKAQRASGMKVWEDDFHPETLESERFYMQKLNYLHENPVRKGLVERPEYWRYSSAGLYVLGEVGPLELDVLQ